MLAGVVDQTQTSGSQPSKATAPDAKTTKQAFSLGISEPNFAKKRKTALDKHTPTKADINGTISEMVVGMGKTVVAGVKTVAWKKQDGKQQRKKKLTKANFEQTIGNSGERSKKLSQKLENMKARKPESLQAGKTSIKSTKTRWPKARNP